MAARQLQKLRQQLQQEQQLGGVCSSGEDEAEPTVLKPWNPFDILSDNDGRASADGQVSSEDEAEVAQPQQKPAKKPEKGSKKKKKKKRKPVVEPIGAAVDGDEDIDKLLEALQIKPAPPLQPSNSSGSRSRSAAPLLAVDTRALSPEDELRHIFGSRIVDAEVREEVAVPADGPRRYRRLAARGLLKRERMKRGLLTLPKDHWPPLGGGGGLEMKLLGFDEQGGMRFAYTHLPSYKAVQRLFEECQASYDPNSIAELLRQHPYHVEALLAMHDLYRATGDGSYADELLERALYALEMAWHPKFSPATGKCRLDFRQRENQPLFVALFRHMQGLSRRGLHATALEVCKLLLALDNTDPMGALQYIDYLAIRAKKYIFLHQLAVEYDGTSSLSTLPSFAFSLALAKFLQQEGGASGSGLGAEVGEDVCADEQLGRAVMMYPLLVKQLMGKLREQGVGTDASWRGILQHKWYSGSAEGGNASLDHLVALYVERNQLLWKTPSVQEWLRRVCAKVIREEEPFGSCPADWQAVAGEVFPPGSDNRYAHLRVSDFSDSVAPLPPEEMMAAMAGGGAGAGRQQLRVVGIDLDALAHRIFGEMAEISEEELTHTNPLLALLHSFLPWVNMAGPPGAGRGASHADAAPDPQDNQGNQQ